MWETYYFEGTDKFILKQTFLLFNKIGLLRKFIIWEIISLSLNAEQCYFRKKKKIVFCSFIGIFRALIYLNKSGFIIIED